MPEISFDDLIPKGGSAASTSSVGFTDLVPPKTVARGSILPISRDESGAVHLDMTAGVPGAIWGAFTAPGDVYTGKQPVITNWQVDPSLIDRAIGMAGVVSPVSAASRAGALSPSDIFRRQVAPPSAGELKTAAGAGYDAARASGMDIAGDAVGNMAQGIQQGLIANHGIIDKTAPKTFGILGELATPPEGAFVTVPGILAARSGLGKIAVEGGTEGLAAKQAVQGIDDFLGSLGPSSLVGSEAADPAIVAQTLREAASNYAAAKRSNELTGTLDRANTGIGERADARAAATGSGRNLDNAIRQRIASFLEKPENLAGYSDAEIAALNRLVAGGAVQNTARSVGNMLGGGRGLGATAAAGLGAYVGSHFGPWEGALGATIPPLVGGAAKGVENALARRFLEQIDELVRSRAPLAQQRQQTVPALGPSSAAMRATVPTVLPDPQQQRRIDPRLLGPVI